MRLLLLALFLLALPTAAAQDVEELTEVLDDGTKIVREVRRDVDGTPVSHGAYTSWHPNGEKAAEGRYEDGERTGRWILRWENGRRKAVGPYANDVRAGTWKLYREKGGLEAEGEYRKGRRTGDWTFYDAKKKVDPKRSGRYGWFSMNASAVFFRGEGGMFRNRKEGEWKLLWPNGVTMATCSYAGGYLQGELAFFRPDGTFEPELYSGVYRAGRRVAPLADAPPGATGNPMLLTFPLLEEEAEGLVTEWLTGPEEPAVAARATLVELGRRAFPAVLNRLVRCDLDEPGERVIAGHLHTLLQEICGGAGYAWDDADTAEARATCALAVQRWQIAWIGLQDVDAVWEFDFALGGTGGTAAPDSPLFDLPLPAILASATELPRTKLKVPEGLIGIGGGAGGEFGGRFGGRRNLRAAGGAGTETAAKDALAWLAANQEADGHWDCAKHGGYELFDVGVTAQALLTLMGDGSTTTRGPYRDHVARGLKWLLEQQEPTTGQIVSRREGEDGGLETGPQPLYEHMLALHALAEATYFSKSPLLVARLQKAVDHVFAVRRGDGLWEFSGGERTGDCSVTVSLVVPLQTVADAGIPIDQEVLDTIARYLDEITGPGGRARLPSAVDLAPDERRYAPDRSGDITGRVLLARFFLGQDPETRHMTAHAERLRKQLPKWEATNGAFDLHALHDGTYAMFQMGGSHWKAWNTAMKAAVLDSQVREGEDKGSWDPLGPYGRGGGRVLSTALMGRTLLVYFRYAKLRGVR